MERLIRFFVERHLLVNTITLAVVVGGLLAVMRTNVEGFPEATMPMMMVTGTLPGAAAQDVETKITIPIEDERPRSPPVTRVRSVPPAQVASAQT